MFVKVVSFWLLLLLAVTVVLAEGEQDAAIQANLDIQNKYLSAENTKQLKAMQDNMLKEMKDYNDENFLIFDQRMTDIQADTKKRIMTGVLGALLVANGIIGLVYVWVTRRYSYERFLEKLLEGKSKLPIPEFNQGAQFPQGLAQQIAPEWQQPPPETVGTMFGQVAVGNQSQMNAWQHQPAYDGGWVSPHQPVSQVNWSAQNDAELRAQQEAWQRAESQRIAENDRQQEEWSRQQNVGGWQ